MPLFEAAGFVTDYRLMELANLNHPLLRQLMLRAPGSYHHSVLVGTLAEAACEEVGANALQARVAAYFHDVGKALKPQYFIENQRGEVNRHTTLDPHTSARVIINHVLDGGRLALEYKLPQPIIDNIYMHHGTGLLQYFFAQARLQADDPSSVDEATFRYPGPKPSTREAGIIMLADKVEAATRTIREPNEENIRAMINQIINSVMADGQFERCPLTFQEIYTIADSFVQVLLGIYHQRIEYPATRAISRGSTPPDDASADAEPEAVGTARTGTIITLEIPNPFTQRRQEQLAAAARATANVAPPAPVPARDELPADTTEDTGDPDTDYEIVENLPRGRS
jgi:putative nucleotidyltransferase with HDIG domain